MDVCSTEVQLLSQLSRAEKIVTVMGDKTCSSVGTSAHTGAHQAPREQLPITPASQRHGREELGPKGQVSKFIYSPLPFFANFSNLQGFNKRLFT